jgi:hypothetical protein
MAGTGGRHLGVCAPLLSGCMALYGYSMNTGGPGRDHAGLAIRRTDDLVRRPVEAEVCSSWCKLLRRCQEGGH